MIKRLEKQQVSKMIIRGLELEYCVCTPCNKDEHYNCVNQFCNCNKEKS